ncbi:MAG: MgpA protein [Parcubacteria group bacterium GW2011_GWA2_43_9b]|nr:MAG: MgpA protein [Parcubacteria group bacterium GW2011_GWA2_43_9b]
MTNLFSQAKKLIDNTKIIAISTHENPDIDGFGSMLAMEYVLKQMGKNVLAFSLASTPNALNFSSSQTVVNNLNPVEIDLIIGLDYGSPERLEILKVYPEIKADILTIDHHAIGDQIGLKIVDGNISSTAELVYDFIKFLGEPINSEIAACLLAGIMSDTGNFRYPNTSAQTLKIAGELMLKGASLQKISKAANSLSPDAKMASLTDIFAKIRTSARSNLVFAVIDHKLFNSFEISLEETDIASILSAAPEAKIAATLTEKTPGLFHVSLRAQQDRGVNVAEIAGAFGGGGHKLAAAFHSGETPENIIKKIENLLLAFDLKFDFKGSPKSNFNIEF